MRFRNRSSERWNNLPRSHRWWDQGRIWTQAGLRPEPTLFLFPNATTHTNTTTHANAAGLCGVCCCITDIICHQYPSIFPHLGVQPARTAISSKRKTLTPTFLPFDVLFGAIRYPWNHTLSESQAIRAGKSPRNHQDWEETFNSKTMLTLQGFGRKLKSER